MPQPSPCPRCHAPRLAVVYYDAGGQAIGGHLHCADCGARHSVRLVPISGASESRAELLRRKAS